MSVFPDTFATRLQKGLALPLPYAERLPGDSGTPASVLILFAVPEAASADPAILFTVRTHLVETHKGQISFVGGARDASDRDDVATALRETEEEIGISRDHIDVLGSMPTLRTVSDFLITPIVGVLKVPISAAAVELSRDEIAEYFWARMSQLRAPGTYELEMIEWKQVRHPTHVYRVGDHRIWGVTGTILKNLLDRLDRVK